MGEGRWKRVELWWTLCRIEREDGREKEKKNCI